MSLQSLVNFSLREPTWVQTLPSSIKCHPGCSCVRCCTCICLAAGHAGSLGQVARFSLIVLAIDLKKLRSRLVSTWLLRLMSDGAGAFIFLVFWKPQCVRWPSLTTLSVMRHVMHRICAHDSQKIFFCEEVPCRFVSGRGKPINRCVLMSFFEFCISLRRYLSRISV
jgi:hypothetical protein